MVLLLTKQIITLHHTVQKTLTKDQHALIPFLRIHIIYDFYLQPNQWVEAKKKYTYRSTELYFHSLLHGVALLVPAIALGIDWCSTTCLVVIIEALT